MGCRAHIYFIIRYSVLLQENQAWRAARENSDDYRRQLFSKNRLSFRQKLFDQLTLSSLRGLDVPDGLDFTVLLITSESLPEPYAHYLYEINERYPWLKVCYLPESGRLSRCIEEQIAQDQRLREQPVEVIASARLDDDDCLSHDFLSRVQPYLKPDFGGFTVSFPLGFMIGLDSSGSDMSLLKWSYEPKIALGLTHIHAVDDARKPKPRDHVFKLGRHMEIDRNGPVILDASFPAYARSVHPENDSGDVARMPWVSALPNATQEVFRYAFPDVSEGLTFKPIPGESEERESSLHRLADASRLEAVRRVRRKKLSTGKESKKKPGSRVKVASEKTQGPKRLVCVMATKRSGHHAFIEWMCGNLGQSWIYFNQAGKSSGGLTASRVVRNISWTGSNESAISERTKFEKRVDPVEIGRFECLVTSLENRPLNRVAGKPLFSFQRNLINRSAEMYSPVLVIFLRDPINAFASLYQIRGDKPDFEDVLSNLANTWISQAKAYLDGAIPDDFSQHYDVQVVSYNRFIRSDDYRQEVAKKLGLVSSVWSRGLSRFGDGGDTRFESRRDYQADPDRLESRWLSVQDMSFIKPHLTDEFLDLARRYYRGMGREDILDGALNRI